MSTIDGGVTIYDLRVEKVGVHVATWKNLWAKAGPNRASINSSEKQMLDYYWSRSYIQLSLKIPSQY